jgi:hypothetical protein
MDWRGKTRICAGWRVDVCRKDAVIPWMTCGLARKDEDIRWTACGCLQERRGYTLDNMWTGAERRGYALDSVGMMYGCVRKDAVMSWTALG